MGFAKTTLVDDLTYPNYGFVCGEKICPHVTENLFDLKLGILKGPVLLEHGGKIACVSLEECPVVFERFYKYLHEFHSSFSVLEWESICPCEKD